MPLFPMKPVCSGIGTILMNLEGSQPRTELILLEANMLPVFRQQPQPMEAKRLPGALLRLLAREQEYECMSTRAPIPTTDVERSWKHFSGFAMILNLSHRRMGCLSMMLRNAKKIFFYSVLKMDCSII